MPADMRAQARTRFERGRVRVRRGGARTRPSKVGCVVADVVEAHNGLDPHALKVRDEEGWHARGPTQRTDQRGGFGRRRRVAEAVGRTGCQVGWAAVKALRAGECQKLARHNPVPVAVLHLMPEPVQRVSRSGVQSSRGRALAGWRAHA